MKKSIKFLLILTVSLTVFSLGLANLSLAADPTAQKGFNISNKLETVGTAASLPAKPNLPTTLGQVIRGLLSVLGIIFLIYTIYAGFLWLTAHGEEEKITKAKAILRGSITCLIIIMAAYAITSFVIYYVGTATGVINQQG